MNQPSLSCFDLYQLYYYNRNIAREFVHLLNCQDPDFLGECLLTFIGDKNFLLVKFLLEQGVDPNRDFFGAIPLLMVINSDIMNMELVGLLMSYGANPYLKNKYGETAYDILNRRQNELSVEQYEELLEMFDSYNDVKEPSVDYSCFSFQCYSR
jgi:ankyrin repeat protein